MEVEEDGGTKREKGGKRARVLVRGGARRVLWFKKRRMLTPRLELAL